MDEQKNTEQPSSKFSKKILIIGVVISLFVFIVGGAFATLYTQTWNPNWNPFTKEQISEINLKPKPNEENLKEDNYSLVYIHKKYNDPISQKRIFLQDILINENRELVPGPLSEDFQVRISPNFKDIAYIDNNKIFLASVPDFNFIAIVEVSNQEGELLDFSWSNDGSEISYFVYGKKTNPELPYSPNEIKIYKIDKKGGGNKFLISINDFLSHSIIRFDSERDQLIIMKVGEGTEPGSSTIARIINSESGDIIEDIPIVVGERSQFNLSSPSEKTYYIKDDYFVMEYNPITEKERILYESSHKGQDVHGNINYILEPILSPSGTKLVFGESLTTENRYITKIFNIESQSIETIFENDRFSNKVALDWSPDERFLWFGVGVFGWGEEGKYFIYDLTTKSIISVLDGQYIRGGTQEIASFIGWILSE